MPNSRLCTHELYNLFSSKKMNKVKTILALFTILAAVARADTAVCQSVAEGDFCSASYECQSSCCDLSTLSCSANTLLDQCSVDASCPATTERQLQSSSGAQTAGDVVVTII